MGSRQREKYPQAEKMSFADLYSNRTKQVWEPAYQREIRSRSDNIEPYLVAVSANDSSLLRDLLKNSDLTSSEHITWMIPSLEANRWNLLGQVPNDMLPTLYNAIEYWSSIHGKAYFWGIQQIIQRSPTSTIALEILESPLIETIPIGHLSIEDVDRIFRSILIAKKTLPRSWYERLGSTLNQHLFQRQRFMNPRDVDEEQRAINDIGSRFSMYVQ